MLDTDNKVRRTKGEGAQLHSRVSVPLVRGGREVGSVGGDPTPTSTLDLSLVDPS